MRLHYANASPFARKVRVVAHELGLSGSIELVAHVVTPVAPVDALNAANPLGKIPALETDDGLVLFDSRVITDFLNDQGEGHLLPGGMKERIAAKTLEALGDGITDALILNRYETALRPEELRWQDWIDQQQLKATRGLDHLEATIADWSPFLSIGSISVACALAYADFRFPDLDWRNGRQSLAAWYDSMKTRQSMVQTVPVG